jgi:hypothetical protein
MQSTCRERRVEKLSGLAVASLGLLSPGVPAQAPCGSLASTSLAPVDPEAVVAVGTALTMSGDGSRIAFGSFTHSHGGIDSGATWVITNPGTPAQTQVELIPSNAAPKMWFAHSLSMSSDGSVLVVGSPMYPHYATTSHTSSVFVYRHDGTSWNEDFHTSLPGYTGFGSSSAISAAGDVFISGAPEYGMTPYGRPGLACVYRHGSSGWCLDAAIIPAEVADVGTAVGAVVAISPDGDFVAMNSLLGASGTVYVFQHVGSAWVQVARLQEPVAYSSGGFGIAIGLSAMADIVAVGNTQDSRLAYFQGAVTLFSRSGTNWSYETTLLPSVLGTWGQNAFGASFRINSAADRVIVGEPGAPNAGVDSCGAVAEFQRTSAGWTLAARHTAATPEVGAWFGRTISSSHSGDRSAFSEPLRDFIGFNSGVVHLYQASCLGPLTYCTAQTNTLGCSAQIGSQGTPSVGATSGFTISAVNVRNQQNGMLFYGTSGRAALPWKGGTLCVQPPLRRLFVVNSGGATPPAIDCSGQLACDFNTWCSTASDPFLFAGQHVQAQYYVRDPGAAFLVNVTDAIEFYLEP